MNVRTCKFIQKLTIPDFMDKSNMVSFQIKRHLTNNSR